MENFLTSQVTSFSRDLSCHIKTPSWNFYKEVYKQKGVPERTTYHVTWGVPQRVPSSVSSSRLGSDASSWAKASGTLKIKMTARKGRWAISPNSRASHPLHFKAVGYYSQSKMWRPLGLTSRRMPNSKGPSRNPLQRILLQGRSTLSNWMKCKEPTGTQSSAKSIWGIVQKLLSDTLQSTLIHNFLEIPWGFLAWAVLGWVSGGLCYARKSQFKDIMWEEKVWFAITQRTFAWETFGKRRNGERKPVLIQIQGSCKHLALKKCIMCARIMGAHVQCGTWSTKGIKNETRNWIPMQPRKAWRN